MRFFVTLFDSNYLTRGLVMYWSLLSHAEKFHLWIVCFDELAHTILDSLKLQHVTLISLSQFEDKELLRIKPERTPTEYFWTCTPSTALYVFNTEPTVNSVTYLDADLMFFSSPEPIFIEAKDASIILTEHRYLSGFDKSKSNGIFNVQFMNFRRTSVGLEALDWWRDRCIEWCFARAEDNKFGDQKYLDDWPTRFQDVHVLQNLGGGLAPWNSAQYSIQKLNDQVFVEEDPLIFYHFHALKLYHFQLGYLCPNYPIHATVREWIYKPYFHELRKAYIKVRKVFPEFSLGINNIPKISLRPDHFYRTLKSTARDLVEGRYYQYT